MYAMALLLQTIHVFDTPFRALGLPNSWVFHVSIIASAVIVLGYIYLGGLTSAIYNEVIQFFLIVAGFFPLVFLGLVNVGDWSGPTQKLPATYLHAWQGMETPSTTCSASTGLGWSSVSDSCSPSATGVQISS